VKGKILEVTYHGNPGGIPVLVLNLIKQLRNFFDIEVCFAHSKGLIAEEISSLGIKTYCAGMKSGLDIKGAFKLMKLIAQNDYDLVHLHYLTPLIRLSTVLARPKAIILTEHGGIKGEKARGRWRITKYIHRFLRNTVTVYTTVSRENLQEMLNEGICTPRKATVIYNGIDLNEFSPDRTSKSTIKKHYNLPADTLVIGTIRGLIPTMGLDHFLLALKYILQKRMDVVGIIVGDGWIRKKLERLAYQLGISRNILFLGYRRDIPKLLSIFDVFVVSSEWETFCIAAVEAMAMGVPVVGYAVGGLPEVIEHNVTGLLIERRDPELLAEGILKIISKEEKEKKIMGEEARKRVVKYFNIEKVALKYKEIYGKIVANKSS